MHIALVFILTYFIVVMSFSFSFVWTITGRDYCDNLKQYLITLLLFMSPMLVVIYPIQSVKNRNHEETVVQYKVYQYEDIPAIVVDNRIEQLKVEKFDKETIGVKHYSECWSYGIYYPAYWKVICD